MQRTVGIIGTAVAGPTFALHVLSNPVLRKAYKPVLFDRGKDPRTSTVADQLQTAGAAVSLFGNGIYPLHQLGLGDAFDRVSLQSPSMSCWNVGVGYCDFLGRSQDTGWTDDLQRSVSTVERRDLRSILISRVEELGGQIRWEHDLNRLERLSDQQLRAHFGATTYDVDLVVGADGAYSTVRKCLLTEINPETAEERWMPEHSGMSGIYGISSVEDARAQKNPEESGGTNAIWLSPGYMASSPLRDGKLGWDMYMPEETPIRHESEATEKNLHSEAGWESKIKWNHYPHAHTAGTLRRMAPLSNPVTGTIASLLGSAERIYHLPLRQRVWELDEIQSKNIVLIGDASRLMLPSSGQGTSFAIEDATLLADALLNNPADDAGGFSSALTEYANARLPRSKKMARLAYWTGRLAMGKSWYWRLLRGISAKALPNEEKSERGIKLGRQWPFNGRYKVELRT